MVATVTVGLGGCVDSNACNYNANADFNDNSCLFVNHIMIVMVIVWQTQIMMVFVMN